MRVKSRCCVTLLLAGGSMMLTLPIEAGTVTMLPISKRQLETETLAQIRRDLGGHLDRLQCPILVQYNEEMPSGRDSSFGAVCEIKSHGSKRQIALCDDYMVGKFFETDQVSDAIKGLAAFVGTHCPPGG